MKKSNFFLYRFDRSFLASQKKKKVKNFIFSILKGNADLAKKQKIFCLLKRTLKKKKPFKNTEFNVLSMNKRKKISINKKKSFFRSGKLKISSVNKKKKSKTKKFIKRPVLAFSNFNLFRLFSLFVYNNPKKFTSFQTKNFLIKRLKLFNFLKKKDFSKVSSVISSWYQINFYSNLEYFYKINYKHPRYKRLKSWKSNKRLKFFNFFTKVNHLISWVKFFYLNFVEKLLFYSYRLRHFWYKKKILLFFLRRTFRFKKSYLGSLDVRIKKKTFSKIENRLDISLVRFGFFKTLNSSRLAITRGLILINFKKIKNINFILKKKDLLFISLKSFTLIEKILNEKHFFFESSQKFFILKKRNDKFIKKKYLNFLFSFFKKSILFIKNYLFCPNSFSFTVNPFISNNFFLVIFLCDFLRKLNEYKRLNLNFFRLKSLNLLVHSHF